MGRKFFTFIIILLISILSSTYINCFPITPYIKFLHSLNRIVFKKVSKALQDGLIFFSNSNCSDSTCPTEAECENSWEINLQQYNLEFKSYIEDPFVELRCTSKLYFITIHMSELNVFALNCLMM